MVFKALEDEVALVSQLLLEYRSDVLCYSLGYGSYFFFLVVQLACAQHLREILLTREKSTKEYLFIKVGEAYGESLNRA